MTQQNDDHQIQHLKKSPDRGVQIVAILILTVPVIVGLGILSLTIDRLGVTTPAPTPFIYAGLDEDPHAIPATPTPLSALELAATAALPTPTSNAISIAEALPTINLSFNFAPTITPAIVALNPVTPAPTRAPFAFAESLIVYVCYINGIDEICLMNGDGSNQRQVTTSRMTSFYPSLSPDNHQIVFSMMDNNDFEIYVMNLDGSNLRQLTDDRVDNYAPDFSPDGSKIVYVTYDEDQDIYVMNSDGSGIVRLTDSGSEDLDPTWSPDGTQISFASTRSGTKELFVMNADGTDVRQITYGASIGGRNDWSHDGRFLTYYAGDTGDKNIYLVSTTCAMPDALPGCYVPPIRLTNGGNNKGPSFSPNGEWVVFAANHGTDNDIYMIRLDGTHLTQLTFNNYSEWQPRWQP